MPLRELLAVDLAANVGRTGFRAFLSAALYHPGFGTLLLYRTAKALAGSGWSRTANLVWRLKVVSTSCHIHLDAEVGPGLILPHPTGIVVGAGCRLGAKVTLYQNVTLGRSYRTEAYPTIGAGAVVFPNAVIVGDVTIGKDAVVGANSVVIDNVPAGAVVAGNPARILRSGNDSSRRSASLSEGV